MAIATDLRIEEVKPIIVRKHILILILGAVLMACNNDYQYSHYESVPEEGWNKDSALIFSFSVDDTTHNYSIEMNIRHNQQYLYQNIWLFTELYADSVLLGRDTLEYYLANQRGEWLGNGSGRLRDMPALWLNEMQLNAESRYVMKIYQGMREEELKGVEAIGVIVR